MVDIVVIAIGSAILLTQLSGALLDWIKGPHRSRTIRLHLEGPTDGAGLPGVVPEETPLEGSCDSHGESSGAPGAADDEAPPVAAGGAPSALGAPPEHWLAFLREAEGARDRELDLQALVAKQAALIERLEEVAERRGSEVDQLLNLAERGIGAAEELKRAADEMRELLLAVPARHHIAGPGNYELQVPRGIVAGQKWIDDIGAWQDREKSA